MRRLATKYQLIHEIYAVQLWQFLIQARTFQKGRHARYFVSATFCAISYRFLDFIGLLTFPRNARVHQ